MADKTNPEELWDTLVEQESRVTRMEKLWETGGDPANPSSARTLGLDDPRLEVLEAKVRTLEGAVEGAQDEVKQSG